jgi:Ca2+/Na+ antiporter
MTDLVWSFAPWVIFLLAARVASFKAAIALGLTAGIVVLARAFTRRRVHMLDIASTIYFVALGAAVVVLNPGHLDTWARYAQAGSHATLTLLVFGSIALGHPFTESYARETTPRELWNTSQFHATNRIISTVWGLAFLLGTVSMVIAGAVDSRQALLRLVVPFGALLFAYKYTERKADEATTEAPTRPAANVI